MIIPAALVPCDRFVTFAKYCGYCWRIKKCFDILYKKRSIIYLSFFYSTRPISIKWSNCCPLSVVGSCKNCI